MALFKKLKQAAMNLSVGDWLVIAGTVIAGIAAVAAGGGALVVAIGVVAAVVIVAGEFVKGYEKNPIPCPI